MNAKTSATIVTVVSFGIIHIKWNQFLHTFIVDYWAVCKIKVVRKSCTCVWLWLILVAFCSSLHTLHILPLQDRMDGELAAIQNQKDQERQLLVNALREGRSTHTTEQKVKICTDVTWHSRFLPGTRKLKAVCRWLSISCNSIQQTHETQYSHPLCQLLCIFSGTGSSLQNLVMANTCTIK